MEDGFELNKMNWFTVKFAEPDDFRNQNKTPQEVATYGVVYAVLFEGSADTHYWSTKTKPVEGQKVYGHLELSSTGKSINFRKAKKEDTPGSEQVSDAPQRSNEYWDDKDARIQAQWALREAREWVQYNQGTDTNDILLEAKTFFKMIREVASPPQEDGYEKAKEARAKLDDPELLSLEENG